LSKGITIYKILIFSLDFLIIVTFTKNVLQIFCAINKCDSDHKGWCFLLKWMVTKKCATQTKMWLKWAWLWRGFIIWGINFFQKHFKCLNFFFKLKMFHHYHYTPSSRNKFSCLPHNHILKLWILNQQVQWRRNNLCSCSLYSLHLFSWGFLWFTILLL
jgi:hypothetical protein